MQRALSWSILAAVLFLVPACAQVAYDSLRANQELKCQKLQGADRDDCMRRSGMSYDEYERELRKQEQRQ
jgi:hypothetical protein